MSITIIKMKDFPDASHVEPAHKEERGDTTIVAIIMLRITWNARLIILIVWKVLLETQF